MDDVRIAVLGAGFMGSAHARAYTSIPALYGPGITPVIAWVIDADPQLAEQAAHAWGAQRWGTDWHDPITDPSIAVIDVCLPPSLHTDVVTAAAHAGHAIYCEKPLTTSAADALALTELTETRGLPTMIGFNLRWAPAIRYLRDLIASGRLGTIHQFSGHFLADWAALPATWDWRLSRAAAGPGALADVGSHILDLARFLVGDIESARGEAATVIPEHHTSQGPRVADNDDLFVATLRFSGGALGVISGSRIATGRKVEATVEVTGTAGAARWNLNRLNELHLYLDEGEPLQNGFRTIVLGPDHPLQKPFSPAHGVGISFLDTKIIEAHEFLASLQAATAPSPSFRDAWHAARLVEQVEASATAPHL